MKKATTFRIIFPLTFDESSDLPSEIQILPVGSWDHPQYGFMEVTEGDIGEFVKHFNQGIRLDLPITEGHEVADEKPAIGWFKKLVNKGSDGLWAVVEWTEKGKDLLRQKAYKYFSPEFHEDYKDPETGRVANNVLVGGALTNKPYFKSMTPVMFSELSIIKHNSMNLADIRVKAASELSAEEKTFLKEHKAELTQDEVTKFSEELADEPAPAPAPEPTPEPEPTPTPEPKEMSEHGMVKISASELDALRKNAAEGVQANSKIRKMEFTDEVKGWMFNETTKKGKIAPKSKDKVVDFMMSLSGAQIVKFREIVGELPDALTFSEVGDSGNTDVSASQELQTKIEAVMKEDSKLTYSEALKRVSAANPDLIKRKNEEILSA